MKSVVSVKWMFFILPLFYLVISINYLTSLQQFSVNFYDGPYAYLLNGINIASGHIRIGNIEHPGVSGDCFAAIVIFIKHLFSGNTILYQDVLLHPESYLYACCVILSLLLALAAYLSGSYVFRYSKNIGLALLFQVAPLFCSVIVKMTICLNAESFITIYGIIFIAYLYINTIACSQIPGKTTTNKNVILFGLFTGLLFTTKIYCAPIFIIVFFMIKTGRQRVIYLASSAVFSMLLLFPVYNQLRNWAGWIKSLVIHSGAYGQGTSGIVNPVLYKNNLIELFTTHYLFTAVYVFVILAFLASLLATLRKRVDTSGFLYPITGILVFFTLFILLIAKQYKIIYPEPLTHQVVVITKFYYFIPIIICFPLFISVSYKILSPLVSFEFFRLHKQKLLYSVLIIFIILGGQKTYGAFYKDKSESVAVDKTSLFLSEWKNTPTILVSDGNKACVEPALFIGISYSGRWDAPIYMDFVKKTYPNSYMYATYYDALLFWGQKTDIATILKQNNQALVYLSGTDSVVNRTILTRICGGQNLASKINYKKIYRSDNSYENIYLLKADTLR